MMSFFNKNIFALLIIVISLIVTFLCFSDNKKIEIYNVYHKGTTIYKNDIVIPIHAGRELKKEYGLPLIDRMIGDNTGDNISYLNDKYSELTALYWIWKNSKADIVGLMHYRRYFDLSENVKNINCDDFLCNLGMTHDNVYKLMKDFDIIVVSYPVFENMTQYNFYKYWHYVENLDRAFEFVEELDEKEYKYITRVKMSKKAIGNNMFIMRKNILDEYAKWLFNILFSIDDEFIYDNSLSRVKTKSNDAIFQNRAPAFVGERLFHLWIESRRKIYKIKEVEVKFIEQ